MRAHAVFIVCFLSQIAFANNTGEERGFNKSLPVRCARIKLKRDALEPTRQWFQTMENQREDLLAILELQGVFVEAVFLDHIGEDDYLIYFMKEESREKSRSFSNSEHPLNQNFLSKGHQEYKRSSWEEKIELEPLLNIDRIR